MAKKLVASDFGWGALIAAGTAGAGAAIGAVAGPPCKPDGSEFLCGPSWNIPFGAMMGAVLAAAGGASVAVSSNKYRNLGIGTFSSAVAGLVLWRAKVALESPAPTPAVQPAPNTAQLQQTPA